MAPQLSAEGTKVNWINYKTGIRHLYFKMEALRHTASIGIEIAHPDKDIRELMLAQFSELKNLLTASLGEIWEWEPEYKDESGRSIARIYTGLDKASVYRQEDWPRLISFFKPRIIALDEFWSNAQYGFELFK